MPVQKKKTSKSKKLKRRFFWNNNLIKINIPFKLKHIYLTFSKKKSKKNLKTEK
uniref:50S ribosomal protein L32 n=2 Tax=Prototheca TaxID=3110 RepID=A0A2Z6BEL6_9CHLO|nr:hypothetical protein [Prototheca stagnorum]BBD20169.1 hypothetical protein [Prototheca stagnorum]